MVQIIDLFYVLFAIIGVVSLTTVGVQRFGRRRWYFGLGTIAVAIFFLRELLVGMSAGLFVYHEVTKLLASGTMAAGVAWYCFTGGVGRSRVRRIMMMGVLFAVLTTMWWGFFTGTGSWNPVAQTAATTPPPAASVPSTPTVSVTPTPSQTPTPTPTSSTASTGVASPARVSTAAATPVRSSSTSSTATKSSTSVDICSGLSERARQAQADLGNPCP